MSLAEVYGLPKAKGLNKLFSSSLASSAKAYAGELPSRGVNLIKDRYLTALAEKFNHRLGSNYTLRTICLVHMVEACGKIVAARVHETVPAWSILLVKNEARPS